MTRRRSRQPAYNIPLLMARMYMAKDRLEANEVRPGRIVSPRLQQAIDRARVANGLPALYKDFEHDY